MVRDTFGLHLIYSTVRIEAKGPAGISTGTAFGYQHVLQDGVAPFLVTNKHVVEGASSGQFFFTRAAGNIPAEGPAFGDRLDVSYDNFGNGWHGHPDPDVDIAVFPTGKMLTDMVRDGMRPYFRPLHKGMIPTQEQLEECDVIEDILFIGYPNGIHDEYNLLPLVRHGITATPPVANYIGSPQVLIDASVFPGSSGSPVFIWDADHSKKSKNYGRPRYLLGVLTASFYQTDYGHIEQIAVPTGNDQTVSFNQMIDIGVVVKAIKIVESIEDALATHEIAAPPANWPN